MAKCILGSIEMGGSKTKCGLALYDKEKKDCIPIPQLLGQVQFATTTPAETMAEITNYFSKWQESSSASSSKITALGVACFGPIDPEPQSRTFGYITTTPKTEWQNYNFIGELKRQFPLPIGWDTDVNAPALAESLWGCAQGCDPVLYLTVGTGLGGGAVVNGKALHGLLHPEMGHILVRSHPRDSFSGCCPYHDFCLEGMASGRSMQRRWGQPPYTLAAAHFAWKIEAFYLAQGLQNYILTLSPQKIILGGGVMQQEHLFSLVRKQLQNLLNDYIQVPELISAAGLENFICHATLGNDVGLYGGLALACNILG